MDQALMLCMHFVWDAGSNHAQELIILQKFQFITIRCLLFKLIQPSDVHSDWDLFLIKAYERIQFLQISQQQMGVKRAVLYVYAQTSNRIIFLCLYISIVPEKHPIHLVESNPNMMDFQKDAIQDQRSQDTRTITRDFLNKVPSRLYGWTGDDLQPSLKRTKSKCGTLWTSEKISS